VTDRHAKRATLTRTGLKKLQQTTRLWRKAQDRIDTAFGLKRAEELLTRIFSRLTSRCRPTAGGQEPAVAARNCAAKFSSSLGAASDTAQ
jgi:hypothetical protein